MKRRSRALLVFLTILMICLGGKALAQAPNEANVHYGEHKFQILDFWKASSDTPTPVLIFFHGGGFVKGDKSLVNLQKRGLQYGISAVSATYRMVSDADVSIREVMMDGARVIQFVRSKATEWNIDPARIALTGGSAGAVMSVWLALHDDLADPNSADPILRHSTRVKTVIASNAATTIDPRYIVKHIGGRDWVHPSGPMMFKVNSLEELDKPEIRRVIEEYSAINHTTRDDPPLMLLYDTSPPNEPYPASKRVDTVVHSATFGLKLKEKLDPLGVECIVAWGGNPPPESPFAFLRRHLKAPREK